MSLETTATRIKTIILCHELDQVSTYHLQTIKGLLGQTFPLQTGSPKQTSAEIHTLRSSGMWQVAIQI